MLCELLSPVKIVKLIEKGKDDWELIVRQEKVSLLLQHQGELLKKIGECLKKNIHVRILEEIEEKGGRVENKGKSVKEIGNYRNIQVQILEEIGEK